MTTQEFIDVVDELGKPSNEINDVKFIEIYEKMPLPPTPAESVMQKIEEHNKQEDVKEEKE